MRAVCISLFILSIFLAVSGIYSTISLIQVGIPFTSALIAPFPQYCGSVALYFIARTNGLFSMKERKDEGKKIK